MTNKKTRQITPGFSVPRRGTPIGERRGRPVCRRWRWPLVAIGLGCLLGCSPYQLAKRTLHNELNEYPRLTDGKISCREYKRWARDEWDLIEMDGSGDALSADYESGFLQGFVDHVYAGGSILPPTMPPRRYWRLPYRNEEGREAIGQWYAGFEHGARVAQEKGYRDLAVIPSSLLGIDPMIQEDWTEIDSVTPIEQLPPADPNDLDPNDLDLLRDELSTPSPHDAVDNAHPSVTPGGLPLPFSDETPPVPHATESPVHPASHHPIEPLSEQEPIVSEANPPAATERSSVVGTSSEIVRPTPTEAPSDRHMQTEALPPNFNSSSSSDSDDDEGPPAPPWQTDVSHRSADRAANHPSDVRVTSAQEVILPENEQPENEPRDDPSNRDVFDPFSGTPFSAISQPDGVATLTQPITGSSETVAEHRHQLVPFTSPGTVLAARPPAIIPLDRIDRIPLKSTLTPANWPTPLGPEPAAWSAKPPATAKRPEGQPAPKTPSDVNSPTADAADDTSKTDPKASGKPLGDDPSNAPAPGWKPIEPKTTTQWKSKE